jgi:hypothetical protein
LLHGSNTKLRPRCSLRPGFDAGILNRTRFPERGSSCSRPRAAPQNAATYVGPSRPSLAANTLFLTAFRAGQYDPRSQRQHQRRLPPGRQRLQFGTNFIAQCQGGKLPDRHQILRRCCKLHPWHGDANLLRIYGCEFVTQDTSTFALLAD